MNSIIEQANLRAGIAPNAKMITPAQSEKAVAIARAMVFEEGKLSSSAAGERARIQAITQSDAAQERQQLANYLAFETDMSADAAIKMLMIAPAVKQKLSVLDALVTQMQSSGKTDVTLDNDLNASMDRLIASRFRGSN